MQGNDGLFSLYENLEFFHNLRDIQHMIMERLSIQMALNTKYTVFVG